MKTILTALPMLAFYLALVCGRRLGPMDTTLFVAIATMQILLFAFMTRSVLRWRRVRNLKRLTVVMVSVALTWAAAYHPKTSPRSFFIGDWSNISQSSLGSLGGADVRPSVVGATEGSYMINGARKNHATLQRPTLKFRSQPPLAKARLGTLPIIYTATKSGQ